MHMHGPRAVFSNSLHIIPVPGQTRVSNKAKADICYDREPGHVSPRDTVGRSPTGTGRLIPADPKAGSISKDSLGDPLSDNPQQLFDHPLYAFEGRNRIGFPGGFDPAPGTPEHRLLEETSKFQRAVASAILIGNSRKDRTWPAFGSSHQLSPPQSHLRYHAACEMSCHGSCRP